MPPSSARQRGPASTARPSTTSARQSSRPTSTLPVYQPLANPLNPTAQHALHSLPTTHPLNDLKQRLQIATNHLNEVTGDLNDHYQAKKAEHNKRKSEKAARPRDLESSQTPHQDDDGAEGRLDEAWKEVEDLTGKMEAQTRRVIDIQARVQNTDTVLKELNANINNGRVSTQSTLGASQFRSQTQRQRRRQRAGRSNSDDEDVDGDDENNHADLEEAPTPALATFKTRLSTACEKYDSLSMKDRYTSHNTYIGFKQIVHDARHPNDDTAMPHASTWFPSDNTTSKNPHHPDAKNRANNNPPSSSSDDEIQIAREKRSIRCPITLLPLSSPLTSTRCPHSFESTAIKSMLAASTLRAIPNPNNDNKPMLNTHNNKGVHAIKCPECSVLLTEETLRVDAALVRKIRKIVEMEKRREREGSEDEEEEGGDEGRGMVEEVGSSPVKSGRGGAMGVKRERMSQVVSQSQRLRGGEGEREVSMVPDSQVVDLGSEESGDEEDD
ncbi:MAG: hypothetical protein Q9176_003861 [Flavoplaca citrina]